MSYSYLTEAFKKLNLLEDDYNFSSDAHKVADELQAFVADDIDAPEEEVIIDTEADTEHDLQDNYIGKVILECACCHSRLYKDSEDVAISEEGDLANIEETCPVCGTESGFKVIGKIEAFDDEKFEEEPKEDESEVEEPSEDDLTDDEIEEALKEAIGCKEEACEDCEEEEKEEDELKESLNEDVNEVEVKTENGDVNVEKDGDKVTIDFAPEAEANLEEVPATEEEMIAPLGDEEIAEIEGNDLDLPLEDDGLGLEEPDLDAVDAGVEDDLGLEGDLEEIPAEEELPEEGEEDEEELPNESLESEGGESLTEEKHICEKCGKDPCECEEEEDKLDENCESDEEAEKVEEACEDCKEECEDCEELEESKDFCCEDFDEVTFDDLCESYLKRVYENVNSFKTVDCKLVEGVLNVHGLIEFANGKSKNTTFEFAKQTITKRGATVLEGMNKTFSNSARAFSLRGNVVENKFVAESMIYTYSTKKLNESNESEAVKVYGRVQVRK